MAHVGQEGGFCLIGVLCLHQGVLQSLRMFPLLFDLLRGILAYIQDPDRVAVCPFQAHGDQMLPFFLPPAGNMAFMNGEIFSPQILGKCIGTAEMTERLFSFVFDDLFSVELDHFAVYTLHRDARIQRCDSRHVGIVVILKVYHKIT